MFINYLKLAWRNLLKNKGYTSINVLGLAIGLAACMLITLYVYHEVSYDRFHARAGRIYRANIEIKFGDNHLDLAVCNPPFGETALNEIPGIENFTRLRWYGGFLMKKGDENIRESDVGWADQSFFDVFSFTFLAGDPKTALRDPKSLVINESIARKYFPLEEEQSFSTVAGKTILINDQEERKITGVVKDLPQNSHFRFKMFVPLIEDEDAKEPTWAGSQSYNTYLLVKENADINAMTAALNKMLDQNLGVQLKQLINKTLEEFNAQGDYFKASLMPLKKIHLYSDKIGELYGSGNIQYVYIFSAIALFILIIACINFMNLASARSAKRAREVGVRKVLGSQQHSLIGQFLSEAVLTTAIAMILALFISKMVLPSFNILASKEISYELLYSPAALVSILFLIGLVGILAGLYPAFYLSSFQPVTVLKGDLATTKQSIFRNALVVFQFTTSVILITGTLIIYKQLDFIRKKDIGYNRDQVLIIYNTDQLVNRLDAFKNELSNLPGIERLTVSGYLPVNYIRSNESFFPNTTMDTKEAISMQEWEVDENYIPTLDMKITEGRNFNKEMKTDSMAIIINEAAARFLGNKDIINKKFYNFKEESTKELNEYHVIGVVKDFHFTSIREQVKPLALRYVKNTASISVRINKTNTVAVLSKVKEAWRQIVPNLPFEYSFMDHDYDKYYKGERKIGTLFNVFAALAIFIACLGLLGLTTYVTEQRTKEIGIRKVLGASVIGVTALLAKDFVRLILISIFISLPVSYYFMSKWLHEFAYRISLEGWMFALAGLLAVLIAFVMVGYQSVKAALMNPVKSLKTE